MLLSDYFRILGTCLWRNRIDEVWIPQYLYKNRAMLWTS